MALHERDAYALVHWMRWGSTCFISKLGRGWSVEIGTKHPPVVYRTKREAQAMADLIIDELIRQKKLAAQES